jgi:hypothetical protein
MRLARAQGKAIVFCLTQLLVAAVDDDTKLNSLWLLGTLLQSRSLSPPPPPYPPSLSLSHPLSLSPSYPPILLQSRSRFPPHPPLSVSLSLCHSDPPTKQPDTAAYGAVLALLTYADVCGRMRTYAGVC